MKSGKYYFSKKPHAPSGKSDDVIFFAKDSVRFNIFDIAYFWLISSIICLSFIFPGTTHAQLLYSDDVSITMTTGVTLTVRGDISSNGTTSINNSGTIQLSGDWINNTSAPVFGASSGTVAFNGTSQDITGSAQTLFHNLTLSGATEVTMQLNVSTGGSSTTGVLNIGSGILQMNANVLNINNPASGAVVFTTGGIVSEETDNSALVKWDIGTTTGSHIVPFMNAANDQIPVNVQLTSGDAGIVDFATYATNAGNTPFPSLPEIVTHVKDVSGSNNSFNMVDRFWYLGKTGATGTANLTFTFSPTEVAASGNLGPRAQRWSAPGDGWFAVTAGQNNPTAFSTRVPGINLFGTWALANETSPLPVELLYFDAALNKNREVDILWVTASEINNDFFTVEKSADGENFFELEQIDGAGNSNDIIEYATVDPKPFNGVSYYRLKQTDFDGAFSYSRIVPVNLTVNTNYSVSVYPNPVSDHFYVNLGDELAGKGKFNFHITDAAGRLVFKNVIHSEDPSISLFRFERGSIAPGIYQFSLVGIDSKMATGKLLFQ